MGKFKKITRNWRVLILIVFLLAAIIAIWPNPGNEGVAIRNVLTNSSASLAGIESPKMISPMAREVIKYINNKPVNTVEEYYSIVSDLKPDVNLNVKTNQGVYKLRTRPIIEIEVLDEMEFVVVEEIISENVTINGTTQLVNKTINKTVEQPKVVRHVVGTQELGLNVYEAPTSNIKKGLDLEGGTRVLLEPERELTDEEVDTILESLKQRLNVYGLGDVSVRQTSDLSGNQYILVEIAGANEQEVEELLSRQGKFEAKIGNETVFVGGENDITYVCKRADCSGIDPSAGCYTIDGGEGCTFRFSITLSNDAADRQAAVTDKLDIVTSESGSKYLSQDLELFLDDTRVNSLRISADLKGEAATEIAISGSGEGITRQEAVTNALKEMKDLQTILITGSLPVKLNVAQVDTISPALGKEFVNNILYVGVLALIGVCVVIFIRYRRLKIVLPIVITLVSEIVLILGFAAFSGWNLDLAAIAGIIITMGTAVDHLVIITDETLTGDNMAYDWKKKLKKAFAIIMGAFFTTVVAMIPLYAAGAGMLKGFALTTIVGITIGVLVSRPAFGAMIEILVKD